MPIIRKASSEGVDGEQRYLESVGSIFQGHPDLRQVKTEEKRTGEESLL